MGKEPSIWMRAMRPHTYKGLPQDVGECYLAAEDEVENIENLKFAVRVPPPPRATKRSPVPPPDEA